MIFALLTTTIVIAMTYLLRRSEEAALAKARSLATLQLEQRERERIARDLELREAAFHKARELELLGRLAGTMAHDFNNALLVVWSALDELAASSLPAQAQESLGDIRLAANQAAAATRQLRAFGPTAPRLPSEPSHSRPRRKSAGDAQQATPSEHPARDRRLARRRAPGRRR